MATNTAKMGLRVWNDPNDHFVYTELANNWSLIDAHNHNGSNSQTLAANSVDSTQIVNNAVTTTKIQDGTVTLPKLGTGAGKYTSGLLSARPAQPQAIGVHYWATDMLQMFVSDGAVWREQPSGAQRGMSIIDTAESITNASFVTATTVDQVTGLVAPTANSLLHIAFSVRMRSITTLSIGGIQLTLNGTPIQDVNTNGLFMSITTGLATSTTADDRIVSAAETTPGIRNAGLTNGGTSDLTVNHAVGDWVLVRVQPGTYAVGLRYTSNGAGNTVSVRNRRLWAKIEAF